MESWLNHMPKDMLLKSDGYASNLYDPDRELTLEKFCAERQIEYSDTRISVKLDTFIRYGLAFKDRFARELENKTVVGLEREMNGYLLELNTGELVRTTQVVLAVGITHFSHIPEAIRNLPEGFISHSYHHQQANKFRGLNVVVIGRGASAIELTAALQDAGANVTLVARKTVLEFHNKASEKPRSLWRRVRHPQSGLGPGLKSRFFADAPGLFYHLPENLRVQAVQTYLGPSGHWAWRERVEGKVPQLLGYAPEAARICKDKVVLRLRANDGTARELISDHVIAATGYRVDLKRLPFLDPELGSRIELTESSPKLSQMFESTAPGLYFVGLAAAMSFGPVMRFAFGARFTAQSLTRAVAAAAAKGRAFSGAKPNVQTQSFVTHEENDDAFVDRCKLKPKILLATTTRWFSPARLAIALANVGGEVECVCPRGNLVEKTSVVRRIYPYRALTPLRSFVAAIDRTRPDLVIPCDDLATLHLHEIYCLSQSAGEEAIRTRTLIERSLGAASSFSIVFARAALMTLARNEGVRVPATEAVATAEDVQRVIARVGFPLILKADATSGGFGVRIVNTLREAERAMREIRSAPEVTRALKWAIGSGDYTLVRSCILRKQSVVSAQEFVSGPEATSAVACWRGKVLASLHFRVIRKQYALGPSTILRVLEHPGMTSAEEKLAGKLRLSGLYGFDYILEEKTGRPYLIEMNPRATQVCHLAMGTGHDLVEALYAALSSASIRETLPVTDNGTIALFPQELQRDPASEYLFSAYHDIPTEEPRLVRACMERLPQNRFWAPTQKWLRSLVNGTG